MSAPTAAPAAIQSPNSQQWQKAYVRPLADDFLRINTPLAEAQQQDAANVIPAQWPLQYVAPPNVGRLNITCVQAKLVRNYGITKMDPYVRIRVGHFVYETQTCPSGGKNPHWDRVIQSQLPSGIKSIFVEIFDECNFKMDELIAWCEIPIPETVFQGQTHQQSYALSGKQGDGLEGAIDVVLSYSAQPYSYSFPYPNIQLGLASRPIFLAPVPHQAPTANNEIVFNQEDFQQVCDIFPNMDKEVVKTVFEANRCNKNSTINSLLQLNNPVE